MDYILIDNGEALKAQIPALLKSKVLAIDTETTGLSPREHKLRLIQIASETLPILLIDTWKLNEASIELIRLLTESSLIKVGQNFKFDLQFLWAYGVNVNGIIFDTELASQLISAGEPAAHNLKAIAERYLGKYLSKELQKSDWSGELTDEQLMYAAMDARILLDLRSVLRSKLIEYGLTTVAQLEFDCLPATAAMEYNGIKLDIEALSNLRPYYEQQKSLNHKYIMEYLNIPIQTKLFGDPEYLFNLDSPSQLLPKLQQLGIPDPNDSTMLIQSTGKNVIKLLNGEDYPIIEYLLNYRTAEKRLTTFIDKLPLVVDPRTGRIHSSYRQIGADTGRYASSTPNLQQIPRTTDFRSCFIPESGYKYCAADYSQVELRIAAAITRDAKMLDVFRKNEYDLHTVTASLISGVSLDKVTKQQRQEAKSVNFGLIFSMGWYKFRQYAKITYDVSLTEAEAKKFRKKYFDAYPGVRVWHESIMENQNLKEARSRSGRLRKWLVPPGVSGISNLPVQGTSADITKTALGMLYTRFKGTDTKIVATVHDEIILECPESTAEEDKNTLSEIMVQAGEKFVREVPIVADAVVANSWAEK